MRVMVVDDDASVRALVRTALDQDMEVLEAPDGLAALARLRNERVDLVLVDLTMPGMDGVEVLARIRRSDTLGQLPVVMLTGRAGEADHVRAFKTGADGYVVKPFEVDELVDEIHGVLNRNPVERMQARREELGRAELLRQIEQRFTG